jgi:hypothetical protein
MATGSARLRGLSGGFGKFAQALAGGADLEQQGFDSANMSRSRMAQALASADRDQAEAEFTGLKTDGLRQRPAMFEEVAALQGGVDLPTLRAFRETVQTGTAPQVPMGPPAEDGGMGLGSAQFSTEQRGRMAQALARLLPMAGNTGDMNPQQWAQALASFGNEDLRGDVLDGRRDPKAVALAQRAVAGEAAYAPAEYGVTDLFSGKVDATGEPAKRFGAYRDSTTAAQRANARQSDASAAASLASAARTRAQANDEQSNARLPANHEWGPTDPATGRRTVRPIIGGPADPNTKGAKLSRPPTEGQAKSIGFGSRMQVADEILSELEAEGVDRSGAIKGVAETAGNILGLGTDSMGGALSDVAGTLTNWTQSTKQQQVEQAQRDFILAILRRESGAAIGLGEFRSAARNYFPSPNDDEATRRQKAAARRTAINAMKAEFGEAYLPDFTRAVNEARAMRRGATPQTGGATGGWDDASDPRAAAAAAAAAELAKRGAR